MIDYYKEYNIAPADSLLNIQYVIDDKLTNELHDKQSQGHTERLAKLQEAKRAFATAASRQKYDQDLADSKKVVDPNAKSKAEFHRWFDEAIRYYNSKQYDYAKNSIEHAFQNSVDDVLDSKFYSYAAKIYASTENFDQALNYADETIIHSTTRPTGYRIKKSVLDRFIRWSARQRYPDWDNINKLYQKLQDTLVEWRAHTTTNKEKAKTFGFEAMLYYQFYGSLEKYPVGQPNDQQAEQLALKAYNLDYSEEQASKILRDIISGYESSKKFEKALKLLEKCESLADKNKIKKEWDAERRRVAQETEAERRRLKAERDRVEVERLSERRRQEAERQRIEAERLAEQRRLQEAQAIEQAKIDEFNTLRSIGLWSSIFMTGIAAIIVIYTIQLGLHQPLGNWTYISLSWLALSFAGWICFSTISNKEENSKSKRNLIILACLVAIIVIFGQFIGMFIFWVIVIAIIIAIIVAVASG